MVEEKNFIMLLNHKENFLILHSAVLRLAFEKDILPYYILKFKDFEYGAQKNITLKNNLSLSLS